MLQGAVGFAFNIFAIPLLILSGLSLPASATVTSIPIFIQSFTSSYKLRRYIPYKDVIIGSILRYLGLPIGIYILIFLNDFKRESVKQVIGVVILCIVILQKYLKIKPKERVSFLWTFLAFFISGITLGAVSMGGPPVVFWVMAHKWSALKIRAFLSALFFTASPFLLALLYYNFKDTLQDYFITGLLFTPVVVAGTLIGVKIGNRFDEKRLKKIILGFLILTSLVSILSPYFK